MLPTTVTFSRKTIISEEIAKPPRGRSCQGFIIQTNCRVVQADLSVSFLFICQWQVFSSIVICNPNSVLGVVKKIGSGCFKIVHEKYRAKAAEEQAEHHAKDMIEINKLHPELSTYTLRSIVWNSSLFEIRY